MLFNSYSFLFAFLPLLLVCWRLAQGYGPTGLALVLLAFSTVFYGLWGLPFLIMLAVILGMNYAFALALAAPDPEPAHAPPRRNLTSQKALTQRPKPRPKAPACAARASRAAAGFA